MFSGFLMSRKIHALELQPDMMTAIKVSDANNSLLIHIVFAASAWRMSFLLNVRRAIFSMCGVHSTGTFEGVGEGRGRAGRVICTYI